MKIEGSVAIVTGGARRVGRALSLSLARAGADVVVNYRASAAEAAETVREIEALGVRAIAVQGDVSASTDVRRIVDAATGTLGRVDILINSASMFERAPVLEITESEWDRVLAVNLKGPFLLSQAVAPLMRTTGGAIVNIVDLSALQPWPGYAHHAVSKAGLLHLTRVLARALAPAIRVNAIAPGTVLPPDGDDGADPAGGLDRRVLSRAGTPDDVAEAMLYLLRSEFVTGETIIVDGGRALL